MCTRPESHSVPATVRGRETKEVKLGAWQGERSRFVLYIACRAHRDCMRTAEDCPDKG